LRSCVRCDNRVDKRKLLRITADISLGITLDKSGKSPGRGTYVCEDFCVGSDMAIIQKSKFERALRIIISDAQWKDFAVLLEKHQQK